MSEREVATAEDIFIDSSEHTGHNTLPSNTTFFCATIPQFSQTMMVLEQALHMFS